MATFPPPDALRLQQHLQQRTAALVALFEQVRSSRMQGVPVLNPALRVQAVEFELCPGAEAAATPDAAAVGILVTPWFMNLVWFSLQRLDQPARAGSSCAHAVGTQNFDFIAGHEPGFGSFEACSLFSPMFEFPDQATAVATAQAVLAELRRPPITAPIAAPTTAPPVAPIAPAVGTGKVPDRRAFLFGRRAAAPGAPV